MSDLTYLQVKGIRNAARVKTIAFLKQEGWLWTEPGQTTFGFWSKETEGGNMITMKIDDAFNMEQPA